MSDFLSLLPAPIQEALATWERKAGASMEAIRAAEQALGTKLPDDLVAFYLWADGASGELGETFLELEPVEGIAARGRDYHFDEVAPHLLLLGTNGGAEGFGFDKTSGELVIVPLHEPTEEDTLEQGKTFVSLLERVFADTQFD